MSLLNLGGFYCQSASLVYKRIILVNNNGD